MRIQIVGAAHRTGTSSKTGKPFDFAEIHYLGKARGVTGQAALTTTIDSFMMPFDALTIPGEYEIEFDQNGRVVEFHPATSK